MRFERVSRTVEQILENDDAPISIGVIPNYMGINLCSVAGLSWVKQEDGQMVSLTFDFMPASKEEQEAQRQMIDGWVAPT